MWDRLYPAVYRVAGSPETWRQALMAACLAWGDGVVVSHIAAAALCGLFRVAQLRRRLDASGRAGRRGTRLLGEMIEVRAGNGRVPESVFETRLSRVLRAAGLPAPVLQHGVGKYRLDFAYPALHVAIEADGFSWHSSRARWDRDIERRNALAVLGWTVIHVTWPQLQHKPEKVVEAVRATLAG